MSASGRTPHLHLSQYSDTDHPSYVSDYTEDMGRIDTGFNLAQTNALTALNRVAALEQSVGRAGAVGQTATLQSKDPGTGTADGNVFTLGFNPPLATLTRNAEPAAVPWTWVGSGPSTPNAAALAIASRGVYRVTVEANVTYQPSVNIQFADIQLATGMQNHCVPLVHNGDLPYGRVFNAACSFVVQYDGKSGPWDIGFETYLDDPAAAGNAQPQCLLTIDVEQLSTEYSVQLSPEPPSNQ